MQARGTAVTGDTDYVDPQWGYPEYPPGSVVELRVHGVGGEDPSGMSRDPHPVAVGGDALVGFWRSRNPVVGPLPDGGEHVREVVSWGGTTSGTSRSAWWVLLLPFALFNAAGRMHVSDAESWRAAMHRSVCRLLALTMTLSVVGMFAGVAFDLLAAQCASQEACVTADLTGRWLLGPLRTFDGDVAGLLALLAALVALVVVGMRRAGRTDTDRLEGATPDAPATSRPTRLHHVGFWDNFWPAWRLRSIHTTAGYAWVGMVLALAYAELGAPSGATTAVVAVEVLVLVACGVLVLLPSIVRPASVDVHRWSSLLLRVVALVPLGLLVGAGLSHAVDVRRGTPTLVLTVVVVLAATGYGLVVLALALAGSGASGTGRDVAMAVASAGVGLLPAVRDAVGLSTTMHASALLPPPGTADGVLDTVVGDLPWHVYGPMWLLVGLQALLLVALLVVSFERPRDRLRRVDATPLDDQAVPGNLGAVVVTLISLLVVTAVGAGLHALVLDWLGTRSDAVGRVTVESDLARDAVGLVLPWWYVLTALVVVALVLLLGFATGGLFLRGTSVSRRFADRGTTAPEAPCDEPEGGRPWATLRPRDACVRAALALGFAPVGVEDQVDDVVDEVAGQWSTAAIIRLAGRRLLVVVVAVTAGVAAVMALAEPWARPLPFGTQALIAVVAIPPALAAQVRSGRRDRAARKRFGNLWDVLTFWPRVAHPFAPPCYGERLVPAVAGRVADLRDKGHRVVLAGHSQGSVVVIAATLHPDAAGCRPDLVTYGSPLGSLYERFFPGVFGGPLGAIGEAERHSRTWHNVLGLTEPLGHPLFASSLPTDRDFDRRDLRRVWPVVLTLPDSRMRCPVCGWSQYPAPRVGDGTTRQVDVLVADPDRVVSVLGRVEGRPLGHSTYHRSRELDEHLAVLAR